MLSPSLMVNLNDSNSVEAAELQLVTCLADLARVWVHHDQNALGWRRDLRVAHKKVWDVFQAFGFKYVTCLMLMLNCC